MKDTNSLNRDRWVEKPKYIYCDNCNEATPIIYEGLDKSLDLIGYGYFMVCKKCKEERFLVYTSLNHHKKTKKQVYPPAYSAPSKIVEVVGRNPYFWKYSKNKTVFKIATLLEEAKVEERKRCLEENYRLAKLSLTEDISHSKFIDDGRKMWSVEGVKNRGIEPCYECENRDKIIKYLKSLDQAIYAITNEK